MINLSKSSFVQSSKSNKSSPRNIDITLDDDFVLPPQFQAEIAKSRPYSPIERIYGRNSKTSRKVILPDRRKTEPFALPGNNRQPFVFAGNNRQKNKNQDRRNTQPGKMLNCRKTVNNQPQKGLNEVKIMNYPTDYQNGKSYPLDKLLKTSVLKNGPLIHHQQQDKVDENDEELDRYINAYLQMRIFSRNKKSREKSNINRKQQSSIETSEGRNRKGVKKVSILKNVFIKFDKRNQ